MEPTTRRFLWLGGAFLAVALGLAALVSPFASTQPDGLNRVAADKGFDVAAEDSVTADSPLAEYAVKGVDHEKVTKGLAGIIGVILTFVVGMAIFGSLWLHIRRRDAEPAAPGPPGASMVT